MKNKVVHLSGTVQVIIKINHGTSLHQIPDILKAGNRGLSISLILQSLTKPNQIINACLSVLLIHHHDQTVEVITPVFPHQNQVVLIQDLITIIKACLSVLLIHHHDQTRELITPMFLHQNLVVLILDLIMVQAEETVLDLVETDMVMIQIENLSLIFQHGRKKLLYLKNRQKRLGQLNK